MYCHLCLQKQPGKKIVLKKFSLADYSTVIAFFFANNSQLRLGGTVPHAREGTTLGSQPTMAVFFLSGSPARPVTASPIIRPGLQRPAPTPEIVTHTRLMGLVNRASSGLFGRMDLLDGFFHFTLADLPLWVFASFLHGLQGQIWHFYHTWSAPTFFQAALLGACEHHLLGKCQGVWACIPGQCSRMINSPLSDIIFPPCTPTPQSKAFWIHSLQNLKLPSALRKPILQPVWCWIPQHPRISTSWAVRETDFPYWSGGQQRRKRSFLLVGSPSPGSVQERLEGSLARWYWLQPLQSHSPRFESQLKHFLPVCLWEFT